MRHGQIDVDKIIADNPNVDSGQLQRNLEMLNELRKAGVKIGPNYTLESPFSTSEIEETKKH